MVSCEVILNNKALSQPRAMKASQESSTERPATETAGWIQCVFRPESGRVERKPQQDKRTPHNAVQEAGRKVPVPAHLE